MIAHPALAEGFSIAFVIFYIFELWRFTHIQYSVLDEGLYLYNGWLFAAGKYIPFQPYGPCTNQMPLAYLIPGWIELIFGPGLRTGRIFAFALGIVTVTGLWLTARRLSGRWIAAGVVAVVALDPTAGRMVSMATSQGLVACLLAWTMFFSLGADHKDWELALSGLLAGATVMVRINMLPLLPLLLLYALWAYGWRSALWVMAGELLVFGGLHLLYWPNILQLWAKFLPFRFLRNWAPPPSISTWNPDNPLGYRIASFFLAFRYHFAALVGALVTWFLWPKTWKTSAQFKTSVYLSVLLIGLFLLHAWASLGNEYCVFCFSTYTSFYAGAGLLLVAVTLPSWQLDIPAWRKWIGVLTLIGLLAGMAYSAEGTVGDLLGDNFYKHLLSVPVPGFGGAAIWQIAANKFRLEYGIIHDAVHAWFPMLVAVTLGLVLLAGWRALKGRSGGAVSGAILVFLIFGMFFSPLSVLAGEYNSYDCQNDVITDYETAGAQLAKVIPAGAAVYWDGYSPVSLLYLPGVKIFPAQLHGTYSFRISHDDDAMVKHGWWNQHLAETWLAAADYVLVEERNISRNDWLTKAVESSAYQEIAVTRSQAACQRDSFFHVFRRK